MLGSVGMNALQSEATVLGRSVDDFKVKYKVLALFALIQLEAYNSDWPDT